VGGFAPALFLFFGKEITCASSAALRPRGSRFYATSFLNNYKGGVKMSFTSWRDSKVKKLDWIDLKLIQLSVFCVGLPIGAYFSVWILSYWWAFILLAVLAAIKPAYKVLGK